MYSDLYMTMNDNIMKIYGDDKWIEIEHDKDSEPYIPFNDEHYNISDYMILEHQPLSKYFDGYSNDTVFSGTFIKLSDDNDAAKLFFYVT